MRYFKCEMGNGLCGCDDNFLLEFDDNTKISKAEVDQYAFESYSYSEGYAGDEYDYGEGCDYENYDDWYDNYYENAIWEYSCIEEIDEEEALRLQEEERWDVR